MAKLPKILEKESWSDSEAVYILLKGKSKGYVHLNIEVSIWVTENGEIGSQGVGKGAWISWSVSGKEKLGTLRKTIPPFIEWCCPEEYREEVYRTLEELGLGFRRPDVPHHELHGDQEGYDE
jgi:hypothetical protein